jgi:hypothetical protein
MAEPDPKALEWARRIAAEADALDKLTTPEERDGPIGRIIQIVRDNRVPIALARALLAGEAPRESHMDDEIFAPLIAELNEVLPLESAITGRSGLGELIGDFIRELREKHPDQYESVLARRKSREA